MTYSINYAQLDKLQPGQAYQDSDGRYWLVVADRTSNAPTATEVCNLHTGDIMHCSEMTLPIQKFTLI